jgi:hypothetical protein
MTALERGQDIFQHFSTETEIKVTQFWNLRFLIDPALTPFFTAQEYAF